MQGAATLWRRLAITVAWLLWLAGAAAASGASPLTTTFDAAAARSALHRLLPAWQAQFTLVAPNRRTGTRYCITGTRGHIVVAGTSSAAILAGVETYLQRVAHVSIGWPGNSLARLPAILPAPEQPIERRALVPNRYALNDTDSGYANAYSDWSAWQHKIDLLALHGYNEVFVSVGAADVYRLTFRQFGYSDAEIRAWIPAPAHQPWS